MKKCTFVANLISLLTLLIVMSSVISPTTYANSERSLDHVCQFFPAKCLNRVNTELKSVKEKSLIWFSLMQFKFSSLFNLQKSDELFQETKYWINEPDLPIAFQVTLYIYHAKYIIAYGDQAEGKKFIYKAKHLLSLMNEAYPSPIRLIELANLQMFIGELPEAYDSLNALKIKYKHSHNPYFMMELYGNLGHIARQLKYFDEALKHWHEALSWSYKYGNLQQIATVLFNLAQAQQHAKKYLLAQQNYLISIRHAEKALDFIRASHARLHLAEIKLALGEKQQAHDLLLSLDENHLTGEGLAKFIALKNLL